MKLLIDANLSPAWVDYFQENGIESVHWYTVGRPDAPDHEILAYATKQDFVILTRDLDFGTMLATAGDARPSVVQIRAHPSEPTAIGVQLLAALATLAETLRQGALVTVDPRRTRARLLPFPNRSEQEDL